MQDLSYSTWLRLSKHTHHVCLTKFFCSSGMFIGPLETPDCSSVPGVVKAGDEN
jgi:hypothetical protein